MPVVLTTKRDRRGAYRVDGRAAACVGVGTPGPFRSVRFHVDTGADHTYVKRALLPNATLRHDGWVSTASGQRESIARVDLHLYFPGATVDQYVSVTARVMVDAEGTNVLGQDVVRSLMATNGVAKVVLGRSDLACVALDRAGSGALARSIHALQLQIAQLEDRSWGCYCQWDQHRIAGEPG